MIKLCKECLQWEKVRAVKRCSIEMQSLNVLENRRKSSFATYREVCAAAWRALQALYLWKSPRKTSFRVRVTAWSFANVIKFIFTIRNKLKVFSPNVLLFSTGLICLLFVLIWFRNFSQLLFLLFLFFVGFFVLFFFFFMCAEVFLFAF